uniref:G domain-containing protein n=1 Tax=Entomoneis paludosa TaxID=265537 RepID=A0A7S3DR38_9STRA|mmetsp:Transcript_29227/g.61157  ORF Transcript_29227/g.61157 Transcript_29227/m.61157 type:complete len:753 (+) Transcript_29227:88-2346(+)
MPGTPQSRGKLVLRVAMFHLLLRKAAGFSVGSTISSRTATRTIASRGFPSDGRPFGVARYLSTVDSTKSGNDSDQEGKKSKKKQGKNQFSVKKTYDPHAAEKLAAAFDELAKKEGFGEEYSHFAADATFEDDFDDDDMNAGEDDDLDPESIDISYFKEGAGDEEDDGDFLDFGDSMDQSMEDRIAAAQQDMDLGRVSVPPHLDSFASDVSPQSLRDLGFKRELNPFAGDSSSRAEKFKLDVKALTCSACGSNFQAKDESRPGYLPPDKYSTQVKLSKIEETRRLQDKAESEEWSTDDEIDWLIQTSGGKVIDDKKLAEIDVDQMAKDLGINPEDHEDKTVICKRCHGLQNFGKVEEQLRPGWSEDPLLAQQKFRELLRPLGQKEAVIVALVDLFDFAGSVLPELDSVAGSNPVIVAANKADLLPDKMGPVRVENWVRRELEYMGVRSLANIGGAVRLVSSKTGKGVMSMLAKARDLAEEMDCDIYLVGAANAGKSTLMNYILRKTNEEGPEGVKKSIKKVRAGNMNQMKGAITTSPLPGTTLNFLKISLDGGRNLYDTPGLLVPGSLTQLLTPEELKIVVPKKQVEPLTLRLAAGKCVLIGGIARVALVGDSKPFFFTFFASNDIKLHQTALEKSEEVRLKHAGELLKPPLPPGPEGLDRLGEWEHHNVDIQGAGWNEAGADIALTGLGWVSITGAGTAQVQISVPKGVGVSVRPPLMPLDIWDSTAKYTGGRPVKKVTKFGRGKRRGIGRR